MPFLLLENGYEISLLLGREGLLPSIPDCDLYLLHWHLGPIFLLK